MNQLPMKERAKNAFAEIVRRNGVRRHFIDKKVLDYMLKKDMVKLERTYGGGANHTIVRPTNMPELPEVKDTGGPFAKRRAALEEAGLNYRGKKKEVEEQEDPTEQMVEFYVELTEGFEWSRSGDVVKKGIYLFERPYSAIHVEYKKRASRIWGVTESGKVHYVKQRATNPKKNAKVPKEEFMWIKLQAKKVSE